MSKEEAIQIVEAFLAQKEFNWEAIYHVDKEPKESPKYWIFKNLWEPRETLRGNMIKVNYFRPIILVDKKEGMAKEISQSEAPIRRSDLSKVKSWLINIITRFSARG